MTPKKILFVVVEKQISELALSEAVDIAQKFKADFNILCLLPDIDPEFEEFCLAFRGVINDRISKILKNKGITNDVIGNHIAFANGKPYVKSIANYLDGKDYDLVVKLSDDVHEANKNGYMAMDISLIRKSPVPVLFINHELQADDDRHIFVAIDPMTSSNALEDLNKELLITADLMASHYKTTLQIVSCWHFEHEAFMRESVFSGMSEADIDTLVEEERTDHETALNNLIKTVELKNTPKINIFKGKADKVIPDFMDDHEDDLLIMGTIGRVGLKGFFIGNTAENIFNEINCSLLTLRPSD